MRHHERHTDKASTRADQARQEANHAAGRELALPCRHLTAGFGLFVEVHLRCGETDKHGKKNGQRGALQNGENAHAGKSAAQHNARGQSAHDVPAHSAALVMGAHTGNRCKHDGGHGRGNRHLDRQIGTNTLPRHDEGHEGTDQHAPADAQQARKKARYQAQGGQFNNQ